MWLSLTKKGNAQQEAHRQQLAHLSETAQILYISPKTLAVCPNRWTDTQNFKRYNIIHLPLFVAGHKNAI